MYILYRKILLNKYGCGSPVLELCHETLIKTHFLHHIIISKYNQYNINIDKL